MFSAADVTAVDMEYNGGRLKVGEYHPVQAEVGSDGTYTWVRIQAGTEKRYAVVLPDRSEIVSLSAGDAITACMAQAGGGDTSGFEAQIAQLTKKSVTRPHSARMLRTKNCLILRCMLRASSVSYILSFLCMLFH